MYNLQLKPATLSDKEFAFQAKKLAFKQYVDMVQGWDEKEQRRLHEQRFTEQTYYLIQVSNVNAGIMAIAPEAACLKLNQIYILPEYQSKGIGAECMRRVIEKATGAGLPVRLQVLKVNPRALTFYNRVGFRKIGETATHILLEK